MTVAHGPPIELRLSYDKLNLRYNYGNSIHTMVTNLQNIITSACTQQFKRMHIQFNNGILTESSPSALSLDLAKSCTLLLLSNLVSLVTMWRPL